VDSAQTGRSAPTRTHTQTHQISYGEIFAQKNSITTKSFRETLGISASSKCVLTLRSPFDAPEMGPIKGKNKKSDKEITVAIRTACGNVSITPSQVAEMISSITTNNDLDNTRFVLPSEEIMLFESGKNRSRRVHDRNLKWIINTLQELKKRHVKIRVLIPVIAISPTSSSSSSSSPDKKREIERVQTLARFANDKENNVDGFMILGLNSGESDNEFKEILSQTVRTLRSSSSSSQTILVRRVVSFRQLQHCIDAEINLVEFLYPHYATSEGHCISLTDTKTLERLNLWNKRYVIDTAPLSKSCACFSCKNHVRAYIHHLLHTHEILARVLLYIHNLHSAYKFIQRDYS